ncbi:hypothetical protein ES703_29026 [subsurface metagenome]
MPEAVSKAWEGIKTVGSKIWDGVQWVWNGITEGDIDASIKEAAANSGNIENLLRHWAETIFPGIVEPILKDVLGPITDISSGILKDLSRWGLSPPAKFAEYIGLAAKAQGIISSILSPWEKLTRPEDISAAAGHVYATHQVSAQILSAAKKAISYPTIAASEEIVTHVTELHYEHVDVPPVLPPNMPEIPNIIFNPPGHPWFKDWIGLEAVGDSIEEVWHGIMSIFSKIKDMFIGIYNWVMETLSTQINTIITGMSNIGTYIADGMKNLSTIIWDAISEAALFVVQGIQNVWGSVMQWIHPIINWVWNVIQGAYAWIYETATGIGEWLVNMIKQSIDAMKNEFAFWIEEIYKTFFTVKEFMLGIYQAIYEFVFATIPDYLGRIISTVAAIPGTIAEWVYQGLIDVKETIAGAASAVVSRIESVGTYIYDAIKDVIIWIQELFNEKIIPYLNEVVPGFIEKISDLGENTKKGIIEYIHSFAPITPDRVPHVALWTLTAATGFGMLAHGVSLACETVQPLKHMGVHYLAGFLGDMGGFSVISAAVMGTLVYTALRLPYSYYVNSIFRPTIPDAMLLNMMRAKREITVSEYYQYMQYHGYSDKLIEQQLRYLWMDPRLFEVIRIAEITSPPPEVPEDAYTWLKMAGLEKYARDDEYKEDWWYFIKFAKAGYDPIDLPVLANASRFAVKRREQTMFMMRVREQYRDGMLTDEQAWADLKKAELKDDVAQFRMDAMIKEKKHRTSTTLKTSIIQRYRDDMIGDDDLTSELESVKYTPERAKAILVSERLRKGYKSQITLRKESEKVEKEYYKTLQRLYKENFRKGLIDAEALEANLIASLMDPRLASVVVDLERLALYEDPAVEKQKEGEKLMAKVLSERIKKFEYMYRALMISKNQLIGYTIAAGMEARLAIANADAEEARMLAPPKLEVELIQ